MKPQLSVLLILATVAPAPAESPTAILPDMAQRMETLRSLHKDRQAAEADVIRYAGELPPPVENPDTSIPEREGTETVAVADGGMLFDANNSRVTYLNNVRVADPRMHVRCSDRLFIQFPQKTVDAGKSSAKDAAKSGLNTPKEKEIDAPIKSQEVTGEATEPVTIKAERERQPICVDAAVAMVNAVTNLIYAEGKTGEGLSLKVTYEQNELLLSGSKDTHAAILADTNGDALITANVIDLKWVDGKGNPCTLHNETGTAYYKASNHRIYFQGPTTIKSTDGDVYSERWLTVTLDAEQAPQKKSSFMPQFSGLIVKGVIGAVADGNVLITRPAIDGKPASTIRGERLDYNGKTGETRVSGAGTTLTYGEQVLKTDDSVQIAENGDITLKGSDIRGTYSRPAPRENMEPIAGTFRTSGEVVFTADSHTITLPNGLTSADELSSITANGKVDILLQPADDPSRVPPREKTGMINLAVAGHKDVAELRATGGITIKYKDDPAKEGLTLVADDAHLNFLTAEATLTSNDGRKADLQYNDFRVAATSAGSTSTLYLAPNGDVTLTGDNIDALLPGKKKPTAVKCKDKLTLNRTDAKLVLGPDSRTVSESGIISANRELYLTLAPGPAEKNKPLLARYPHMVYNYSGIKLADTASGGSVQTNKASMQCSGAIHVEMQPGKAKNDMGGISKATAAGNVAIAGKDPKGRMIRATGDYLTINGATGTKVLTGNRVTLQDTYNTHIASGGGARIVLDRKNNATIRGAKQSTAATRVKEQVNKNKTNNKKK